MKNNKENRLIAVLDYMKKTLSLFTSNKKVLFPIIYYCVSKTILGIIFILSLIPVKNKLKEILPLLINSSENGEVWLDNFSPVFDTLLGLPLLTLIVYILFITFAYTWLEAKIFTSIARTMPFTVPKRKSTLRTFLAFLLANIIIYLAWIILAIPYVIIGSLSLMLGFTLIPFIIDILLMYYKGIYVVTENNILLSLKESIRFAWKHFVLSMILQIFTMLSNLANFVGKSTSANRIQNLFRFNFQMFESDFPTSPESLDSLKKIDEIENGISAVDILNTTNAMDIATNIVIPIAILLLIASALVFFVRSVILAYFAFTSTYVYCDITSADKLLLESGKEINHENI